MCVAVASCDRINLCIVGIYLYILILYAQTCIGNGSRCRSRGSEINAYRLSVRQRTKDTRSNWNGPLYSIASLNKQNRKSCFIVYICSKSFKSWQKFSLKKKQQKKPSENKFRYEFFWVSAVQNNSNPNSYLCNF